jgi:hypothetical protein
LLSVIDAVRLDDRARPPPPPPPLDDDEDEDDDLWLVDESRDETAKAGSAVK